MTKPHKNWIVGIWDGSALRPASQDDRDLVAHLKSGARVRCEMKEFRSLPRHAFYWAVLREVCRQQDIFTVPENLHRALLMACGVVEIIMTVDGEFITVSSSTSFEKMDEVSFKKYFDSAMLVIHEKIIPGVDINALLRHADDHSAGTRKPYHGK